MASLFHFIQCIARSIGKNAVRIFGNLVYLGEVVFKIASDSRDEDPRDTAASLVAVDGPQHSYTLLGHVAVDDVADSYFAHSATEPYYTLKISRIPEGYTLLDNERQVLTCLLTAAGDTTYRKYLPTLIESFAVTDSVPKRVNVFQYEPGFYTLEQVHDQHPQLDARHLAWIFKRILTILGFSHAQRTVHGAVLPCHVLIQAAKHGVQLVGWGHSVEAGQRVNTLSTRYRDWYPHEVLKKQSVSPARDLFLAAQCLIYLAGGDPVCCRMPDAVPVPMRRFVETCLLESAKMRPNDAWWLLDEFDDLLSRLYGPPQFHPLTMT